MLKRKDDKMHLIILGAGGYGRTVADVAARTGRFDEISFLDDNSVAPDVAGKCAEFERFHDAQTAFYPAFGNNESRLAWLHRLQEAGCAIPTIIHPTAYVSPTAQVEDVYKRQAILIIVSIWKVYRHSFPNKTA